MAKKILSQKPVQGVYMIMNFAEKKAYVGETKDIKNRLKVHRNMLSRGYHYSRKLQADWDRLGEGGFEFMVMETNYPWWQGPLREQFWIDVMRSLLNYNSRPASPRVNLLKKRKEEGLPYSIDFPPLRNVPTYDWVKRQGVPYAPDNFY